jgi:cell division transport system permease protein
MTEIGKGSAKRSQPSYFMAILGVSLVLFILGILGWIVINANKLGDYFKENVELRTVQHWCNIFLKSLMLKSTAM